MRSPKSLITRKAAKAVVTHSAHGSLSKVKRRPVRSGVLLAAGGALGAAVGYLLGRRSAPSPGATATGSPNETASGAPRPVAAVPDEAARAAGAAASTV